jgi:PST family polysaccharide transporter
MADTCKVGTSVGRLVELLPRGLRGQTALARATAKGAALAFGQNVAFRIINLVSQLVLARLLAPADFGQVTLVLATMAFLNQFTDFGIEDVLISRIRALRYWIGPAYGLSLTLAVLAGAIMMAVSPLLGALYRIHDFVLLSLPPALNMALCGLSTIPGAKLRAELRFGVLSAYNLTELTLIQIATVALAWNGFGAFSFVLPLPFMAAAKAVILQRYAQVPMRRLFRVRTWRRMLGRSSLAFGQRLLLGVREQGDNVMLGLMASQSVVGAYALGFRLAAQPVYLLIRSLSVALLPAVAQLASDPARQAQMAVRSAQILAYVVTPLSFLEAATAGPILEMLFGPKWRPAVPFVEILSIGLAFEVLPCVGGALANARGRFRFQFQAAIVTTACFLAAIFLGFQIDGPTGLALAVAVYFAVMSLTYGLLAFRPMDRLFATLFKLWFAPFALSAIGVGAGAWAANALAPNRNSLVNVALTIVISALAYSAALGLAHRRTAATLLARGVHALRLRLSSPTAAESKSS